MPSPSSYSCYNWSNLSAFYHQSLLYCSFIPTFFSTFYTYDLYLQNNQEKPSIPSIQIQEGDRTQISKLIFLNPVLQWCSKTHSFPVKHTPVAPLSTHELLPGLHCSLKLYHCGIVSFILFWRKLRVAPAQFDLV